MKKAALCLLIWYKKYISPLLQYIYPFVPPACRFYPTCSEYMYAAIVKYGLLKGVLLGVKRILRCNPLCKGGYDPVP